MSAYDFKRPFIKQEEMKDYISLNSEEASMFGRLVKASNLSNVEYKTRYGKLKNKIKMKSPPSCGRIFSGYVVVRKLGLKDQYETWMPDHVFEEYIKRIIK